MLDNQQIYNHIPKKISQWQQKEVNQWFKINDIELNKQMRLNGQGFMELTASKLLNEYELSMFMTRKVMDWIEFEGQEFDEYVEEMEGKEVGKGVVGKGVVGKGGSDIFGKEVKQIELIEQKDQQLVKQINLIDHQPQAKIATHPNDIIITNHPNLRTNKQHNNSDDNNQQQQQILLSNDQNSISQQLSHYQSINEQKNSNKNSLSCRDVGQQRIKTNKQIVIDNNCCSSSQVLSKSQSSPIKAKKPININIKNNNNIKPLMLSDLIISNNNNTNTGQQQQNNNYDIETCKYIPQQQQRCDNNFDNNYYKNNRQQFIHHHKQFSQQQSTQQQQQISHTQSSYQNNTKFVTSHLVISNGSILSAFYQANYCQIMKTIRIGRNSTNDIVLRAQGVSRNHAQILVQQEINSIGQIEKRYYLRDVGSKYGTFVQTDPQRPKKVYENQQYCIGLTTIKIDKLKLYKSKQKFDLTLTIILSTQQQRTFQNKSLITIGNNKKRQITPQSKQQQQQPKPSSQSTKRTQSTSTARQKRDIQLEDNQVKSYHCRFVVISGQVYLQQVQGNILQKIQKDVKYPLNKSQCEVKFGDGNVVFRYQQLFKTVLYDQ